LGTTILTSRGARQFSTVSTYHFTGAWHEPPNHYIARRRAGRLEHTVVRPPLYVDYGVHIQVGARTFANFGLVALDVAEITIGHDVQIGPNVQLLTPIHPVEPEPRRNKLEAGKPISIGNNVWLGGGAIVCPGVTIGENAVVGAGAVVTSNLAANVLAVGNPARAIREI